MEREQGLNMAEKRTWENEQARDSFEIFQP